MEASPDRSEKGERVAESPATPPPTQRRAVQSVTRAFEILEALAEAGRAVGITDIAERVDLPLPTIHRILHTLIDAGYVFQTPRRRYALGARLIPLSRYAGGALGVTLRPYLSRVVESVGESASIAMLDQDFARYISHVPAEYSMRMFTEIGNQVSLHATGVGKAILSTVPLTEAYQILQRSGLRRFTEFTITDIDAFMRELEEVRRQGFALDLQEHELGVRCVAVPVPGTLRLSLSVSGPSARMSEEKIQSAVPLLQTAARELADIIEQMAAGRSADQS